MTLWTTQTHVQDARRRIVSEKTSLYKLWAENFNSLRRPGAAGKEAGDFLDDASALGALCTARVISPTERDAALAALRFPRGEVIGDGIDSEYLAALFRSFVQTFRHADVAHLLNDTGEFRNGPLTRMYNTVQMMMKIIDPGEPEHTHCLASAYLVGVNHRGYETGKGTRRVNQSSLAYTLLTFSHTPFLVAPKECGDEAGKQFAEATAEQQDGFLRFWSVIGSALGIDRGGRPENVTEATSLLALLEESTAVTETAQGGAAYQVASELFHVYVTEDGGPDADSVITKAGDLLARWPSGTAT